MLIEQIQITETGLVIAVVATHPTACCPLCSLASSSMHSHYRRVLRDAPLQDAESSCASRCANSPVVIPAVSAKSSLSGCADAHSSPLLEESNTIGANMVKALPYLTGKPKGDTSMEGKRSARSTLSQEAAQARPHKVSPGLGERQATRCR